MKKQKLHHITRIAALSFLGALTVLGTGEAAQQSGAASNMMPPIVSGSSQKGRTKAKLLVPSDSRESSAPVNVPAIVKGNGKAVGTGIVQQVSGKLEPLKQPMIAKAFSPAKIPVSNQGSGTRNVPAPAIQIPSPMGSQSVIVPPMDSMQNSIAPSAPVISGSLVSPDNGQIAVSPNYFDAAPVMDPVPMNSVVGNCSTGTCGSCDSCNNGRGYDPKRINCDYGTYGSVSAAKRYAYLEALYMTREDGDITNSNFNPLGEFDFGLGWRFTLGQRPDMTQGREISYFGTMDIENRQVTTNAENRLDALFSPAGAIISDDLSAFFDANRHVQYKENKRS